MKNATLRQLRVFESAARHLSLTRAAEELHLTPPAVSIQIRQLEGHANARLFERLGRGLRLTQAGEEVLAHARDILAHIRASEEAIAGLEALERGLLDVAVINAGDYFLPWLIAAFRGRHPGIRARLTVGNREELLARLAAHEIDLAVMSHAPTDPAFAAQPFARHPHVIVAPPGHPLAMKRSVALEAVAREPLISREPGSATRLAMDQAFAESGVVPRIEMEIASNETIKQSVAAGFGLGFLSGHAVQQELALGRLAVVPVKGFPVMRQWYVVHRRDRVLPRIAEAFERFVVEQGARLIRGAGGARAGVRR
ncbi:MAG TPA: LysR substrate-binding domain-containing protein [Steroidobacteraceae bacterium]|jgi:DNA-binding transcriptional LysR family regulator|nr:LysR substrate-binding domain-containing protein [Steroidobacteraceae bacterium]